MDLISTPKPIQKLIRNLLYPPSHFLDHDGGEGLLHQPTQPLMIRRIREQHTSGEDTLMSLLPTELDRILAESRVLESLHGILVSRDHPAMTTMWKSAFVNRVHLPQLGIDRIRILRKFFRK
ncbi:hypothetical protein D3C81_1440350 [compost metagenome]